MKRLDRAGMGRVLAAGLWVAAGGGILRAATLVSGAVWDGSGGPWTGAGSPYVVTADVTVPPGRTLTIAAGVVVKFAYGGNDLIVDGTLLADGTPAARIVFTSDRDDTAGGDTNGDGGNTSPYPDIWGCLRFTAASTGSVLDNVEVRYAGWDSNGGIWVQGGQLTLTDSLLTRVGGSGVRIEGASPTLTGNTFTENTWAAVAMDLASSPAVSGSTVAANRYNGLVLDPGVLAGDRAWDDPDLVHVVLGDITVPAGRTLTIAAGVVVKFAYGSNDLIVDGALLADGTPAARIVFTSDRDDTAGGDTDGNGGSPHPDIWGCLRLTAASTGSVLDNVEVRYAGWDSNGGIWVQGGQLTLTDSLLTRVGGSGVRIEGASPTLTGNTFTDNTGAAVAMDLNSNPTVRGVTVTGNGTNGLVLDSGTLAAGGLAWDDPDIVYVLYGDVTVPAGSTLTIAAGQIVKAGYGTVDLLVNGTLVAAGTAGAPVEFTSDRDDTVGGDTNNNANGNGPYRGVWGGVKFSPTSTSNSLQFCRFSYGGWDSGGLVLIDQAGVTMAHCTLRECSQSGVRMLGAAPKLSDTVFSGNSGSAASMDLGSNPEVRGVTATGNGVNGLTLDSGALPADGFWDDPDITYVLSGDVAVPAGRTLSVAPGQVVKVAYGSNLVTVEGALLAPGTAAAPIVFTSDRDDTAGGDTNNNGDANGPYRGIWGGLRFEASSAGSILEHVEVRYAGWDNPGAVWVNGGQLRLSDGALSHSNTDGVRVAGSSPVLLDNRYDDNRGSAVSMDLASNPDVRGVTLAGNGSNALTLDAGPLPADGFWDDPDIVYRLSGDVTVPPGVTLTVAPGQVVKMAYGGTDLVVQGTLLAGGTGEAPIVVTSEQDDSVGGDTNNNGNGNGPYRGIWGHVRFAPGSAGNVLSHVGVYYPGWGAVSGIEVVGAQAAMTDCTVYGSSVYGVRIEGAAPQLTRTHVEYCSWAAVSMDLASAPAIRGVALLDNGQNGLRVDNGVFPGDAVWDNTEIVHILPEDVTVPVGATLTLAPGLVVKSVYGSVFLVVEGTLSAAGTVAAPIVFTADRDDTAGGDTNNSADGPYRGYWGGLAFTPASQDSVLDHVEVRYGGGWADAMILADGSPVRFAGCFVSQSGSSGIGARNSAGLELVNTIVSENNLTGVFALTGAVASLVNCTVDRNATGVHTNAATAVVTNTLVTRNTSSGLFREGTSSITVSCCDVYNPGAGYGDYRNMGSQTGQNGNLSADPLYTGKGPLACRLQDQSPAIDAGTSQGAPLRDFLGLLRYDHPGMPNAEPGLRGTVDMGAFEFGGLEPLDIDLAAGNVVGPATGTQNGMVRVSWEVSNTGTAAAAGTWFDAVYLSADGALSADDRLIGTLEHTGGLGPGASYNAALDILLQGVVPGSFHFLVVADARQETREGGPRANNAAPSAAAASFSMPQLTLGVPAAGTFAVAGDLQYYQVLVPTGSNLFLRLDDADNAGVNGLYLSRGTPPTPASAQYSAGGGPDQAIAVPAAPAGTWYVLVSNTFGTGGYTLLAEATQLGLYSAAPASLGNGAEMVFTLAGAGFVSGTSAALVSGTGSVYPGAVTVDSFRRLTVVFPAAGVPPGVYTVRVSVPAGESAELPNAVEVTAGGEAKLETRLILPARLGYHQLATLYVEYTNAGSVAMQAPLLRLTASQNGREAALMTLDTLRVSDGFWTTAMPQGFSRSVQFLGSGATPGILQPGESGRVPVYWAGWLQPWDFGYPPIRFRIGVTNVANAVPVGGARGARDAAGWDAYRDAMRPPGVADDAWQALWPVFVSRIGSTWGEYVAMLDRDALYLGSLGYRVESVPDLLAFELQQADGLNSRGALASAVDAAAAAPVLPLVFGRSFPNSITGRYRLGAFGRGWAHPWEVSLSVSADGTVRVRRPHRGDRVFQPDARGGYTAGPGDHGRLAALGGNAFLLVEKTGMRTAFRADGLVDYLADPNGNRISCTYAGGRLTRLAHSAGQALTLAYNEAGRIVSVTDPQGRQSTFAYDAAGEHLLTVTRDDGRVVRYAYTDGAGTASAHALAEIAYPDGSHRFYSYDTAGRCTGTRRDADAEAVALSYPSTGVVQAAHAMGQVSTFSFDHRGNLARAGNARGEALYLLFDDRGELTRVADTDGRTIEMAYDARGNLLRLQDPLGQTYAFAYASALNRLVAATDPGGHTAEYTYDQAGNRLSAALEGSAERFAYDSFGQMTSWTNRRGQVIGLTRDGSGRLTLRDYPDAPDAGFVYDARGNLIRITDATGTTSMTYDAGDRLTRITYPGDRCLEFTYDAAGRRSSRSDHLGNRLSYAYDSAGRLETITDGAGDLVVRYRYDPSGRLAAEERGGGTTTSYAYDLSGRLTAVSHRRADQSLIAEITSTCDSRGLCTSETSADGTWTYAYDGLERLASASFASANALIPDRTLTYAYDAVGNRTRVTVDGTETLYTTNGRRQVTRAGAAVYTYDADGNLVRADRPEGTTTYTYDSANRLLSVSGPDGTWSYAYNAFGDRVASTRDGVTTYYLIDPLGMGHVAAEFDAAGSLLRRYDYGLGLVRQTSAGQSYYYLFTPGGSTDAVATPTGTVLNRYLYDPFGAVLHQTETVGNAYKYVGAWGVTDEGNGLHYMRMRYYLPELARFTGPDPLGVPPWGLYAYCANDGVNRVDPMGLAGRKARNGNLGDWVRGWRRMNDRIEELDSDNWREASDRVQGGRDYIAENSDQVAGEGIGNWLYELVTAPFWSALPANLGDVRDIHSAGSTIKEVTDAGFGDDRNPGGSSSTGAADAATGAPAATSPAPAAPPTEPPSSSSAETFNDVQPPQPDEDDTEEGATGTSGPADPNAKLGPAGVGDRSFVLPGQVLPYRVDFENESTAGAPAQYVNVRDPLSPSLDWGTFELTELGFGDRVIPVPPGSQSYAATVPMSWLGVDFEVHVQAALDPATGVLAVDLFSIDPGTGLPPPVEVGFLPPEDGTGRGRGYFAYVIRPRAGLPTGTEIRNVATITFDFGEVIDTDQVDPHDPAQGKDPAKQALVTIDASAPVSAVDPLPAQSLPGFPVAWSGSDAGSGIASYTIYVSADGGPFEPWLSDTPLTTAVYPGAAGHAYGFFSIARDATGHVEPPKAAPEAVTTVVYTVAFLAGEHGVVEGPTPQRIAAGGSTAPVEAVPNPGYHFVHWLRGAEAFSLANPLIVTDVNSDLELTAEFEINRYEVVYGAGPGGSIAGIALQVVEHGGSTAPVTAVPAFGFHFRGWSDGSNANPRSDANITGPFTVTAEFEVNTWTVTHAAGPNGSLNGPAVQQVQHGSDTAPVAAIPDLGFHFVRWTRGGNLFSTANPLVIGGVTEDMALLAEFAVDTVTVVFQAGPNGSIAGPTPQVVARGAGTEPVAAVPAAGYHFVRWTRGGVDYSTVTPLTLAGVLEDMTLVAEFAVNRYTITFVAGPDGSLAGDTVQTVAHGSETSPVTAVPDEGHVFVDWDDGSTQNPRVVTATEDRTLTARFRVANPVPPNGPFVAGVDADAVARGHGWWDVGGAYALTVAGSPMALNLVHDTRGKLTGTAVFAVARDTVLDLPVKGSVKGAGGEVLLKIALKGSDAAKTVSVSLSLALGVNGVARRLEGQVTGSIRSGDGTRLVNENLSAAIPGTMDGTWTLRFALVQGPRSVGGTATLTLSNGAAYRYLVKGKQSGTAAVLTLSGDPYDPPARGIKIKTTITPAEDGSARLESFSGKGYGQTVAW